MSDYADRFTALIDANVLACAMRRNLILSLAEAGFFRPRWSDRIMDETAGAIAKITKGGADTNKQRSAMERAFPEACVSGYAGLEAGLEVPRVVIDLVGPHVHLPFFSLSLIVLSFLLGNIFFHVHPISAEIQFISFVCRVSGNNGTHTGKTEGIEITKIQHQCQCKLYK